MNIYTEKYHGTFSPKLYLTRILGINNYYALHQIKLELKTNALSVK